MVSAVASLIRLQAADWTLERIPAWEVGVEMGRAEDVGVLRSGEAVTMAGVVVLLLKTGALGTARVVAAKRRTRDVGFIFDGGIGFVERGLDLILCFAGVWDMVVRE